MRYWAMGAVAGSLMLAAVAALAVDQPAQLRPAAGPVAFPPLSPAEELKTFQLPPGYHMELVVADPIIKEPVACAFDGDGRMYVAEMRTYMQNIDGENQVVAQNQISLHVSSHGDGVYDQHTVFLDHILPPREILPLDKRGVLITQTNSSDIYLYNDTHHTGVSDSRTLFYQGGPEGGNIEHQDSGLIWDLDNWIYQARSDLRLRFTGGKLTASHTPPNGGQWGLCQDDYGKLWFVNAGGELGPIRYQVPIAYGAPAITESEDRSPDFQQVWPLVGLADVQGGPMRFRPADKTLNHFTACAGIEVYRGDALPADLRGDVLINEPVGRLIRRAKVENHQGITYLKNAYDQSEFLRSTDPNFRPVNITNGPDGCLYIVDMYRGIIQESHWVNKGSYLRTVVTKYGMENVTDHGRIWRLVYDGMKRDPQPRMLEETPAELVKYLDHPNGWWRTEAQKLIVLSGDHAVVPALAQMARSDASPLGRIHALWTLEGLGALDAALVREKLADTDPQVRLAAIRCAEAIYHAGDVSIAVDVKKEAHDHDPNVALQSIMTIKALGLPDYFSFGMAAVTSSSAKGVRLLGPMLLNNTGEFDKREYSPADIASLRKGQNIYLELCFACHGYNGAGMPLANAPDGVTQAPPLAHSPEVLMHRDNVLRILLSGLSGPVHGKTYTAQMVSMGTNNDQWIADVASFVRNSFGNHAGMVSPANVAALRAQATSRGKPWTVDELTGQYPQIDPSQLKIHASSNSQDAEKMIDGNPKTHWAADTLAPDLWVSIELPSPTTVCGLLIDSSNASDGYTHGYKLETSDDGVNWSRTLAEGQGNAGYTEINFSPTKLRYLRLTQTGKTRLPKTHWSIDELSLVQPPANP